jgi:ketosteroid isomerase-like protein
MNFAAMHLPRRERRDGADLGKRREMSATASTSLCHWQYGQPISVESVPRHHARHIINAAANGLTDHGAAPGDSVFRPLVSRPKYRMRAKRGNRMSVQDNKDVITRGYAAFAAGDIETVMSLFDDDCEWVQPGDSAVSGTFHGKAEVMEHFGRLAEKGLTVKLERLVAEGDTVVALTEVTADGQTGHDADVFVLRDGKTVHVEVHGDTALLERVYGKKQLAAG